ncbi:MAG: cystathionine gamma-lyase, O-acetylhomoserine (thiol)-lyase [Chloroflexi bacterium CSP1-4]|nr:MAG: cystathionine gamma-lyase, O-acetylhomoserine (thiol)-lyase [Chloroflexi bacterium CSP1-4]
MTDEPAGRPVRGFSTRAILAATRSPKVEQHPTAVPIYQSATFAANDAAEFAAIIAAGSGYTYARLDNPTASAMAAAVAELEGAESGFAFGSGMAAIHAALAALVRAGDRIVATRAVYGSTRSLLDRVFARFGVETTYVDATDADEVSAALPGARLLYLETISNPTLVVVDIPELAERAHRAGALVVVDNTFASPYLCRPIELGADLVVESATKWLSGHSDVIAGAVSGPERLVREVAAVEVDTGGIVAPFSAFLVLRGIATLPVRMDRHSETALALARFLESALGPRAVVYPGLASHPQAVVAQRLLRAGGGMLAIDLVTRAAALAFIDGLAIPERTASLGSIRTLAVHAATTSHRQYDGAALAAAGISEGLVRVSVGLEDVEDLVADVADGLAAARSAVPA